VLQVGHEVAEADLTLAEHAEVDLGEALHEGLGIEREGRAADDDLGARRLLPDDPDGLLLGLEVVGVHARGRDLDVAQRDADHVGLEGGHLVPEQVVGIALGAHDVHVEDLDLVVIGQVGCEVAQADRPHELELEGGEGLDEEDAHGGAPRGPAP